MSIAEIAPIIRDLHLESGNNKDVHKPGLAYQISGGLNLRQHCTTIGP